MSNKITYRRDKKSQLTSNEVDDNFKYLDERIDKVSEKDYIVHDAGYTSNLTTITVNKGCKWVIGGVEYSNDVDFAWFVAPANKYRVDVICFGKNGEIQMLTGLDNPNGYVKPNTGELEYLIVYVGGVGIESVSTDANQNYVSKLSFGWLDVDHSEPVLQVAEQHSQINIIGGNKIIDTVANGIFEIAVPATFSDGYEVAIRNLRSSYLTLVNSAKLRIYTGQNYTVRPGEIVVFKYDKREQCFAVSGALDIRLDWQNVDEIIGVDSMRMVVDSSKGDALNPNNLNTKLTPTILRYFKDYTSDAVGWQWKRFSGDEAADTAWAKGKNKRVLELTPIDFTDAINKGNVSFMCTAVVNNADVVGVWVGKLVDTAKTIRIQSTGTQFKGNSPEYILLRAIANNISVKKIEWFKDDVLTNISDSMMVYNNQVSSFVVMKLRVTGADGVVYEDAITLSKVVDGTNGKPGVDGKQGAVVVWTEWMTGSKHYNNDKEIYYIYHRPTQTVWKLKDGYNDIVAPANPDARYVQQPHLEQVVTKVLVAEGANIAGFIFKDGKMVSQYPNPNNPDLILDGTRGEIVAKKLTIVPGSPASETIDQKIKEGVDSIQVGGRNLLLNTTDEVKYIQFKDWNYYHPHSPNVRGNTVYTGRYYIRSTDNDVTIRLFEFDKDGRLLRESNNGNVVPAGSPPSYTQITITTLPNTTKISFIIRAAKNVAPKLTGLNYSECKLEPGNKYTPWSPAPEDLSAQIDSLEIGARNFILSKYRNIQIRDSRYVSIPFTETLKGIFTIAATRKVVSKGSKGNETYSLISFKLKGTDVGISHSPVPIFLGEGEVKFTIDTKGQEIDKVYIYSGIDWAGSETVFIDLTDLRIGKGNKVADWTESLEDINARIKDQELYTEYSVNGTSAWHTPATSADRFMRQKKGDGAWSVALPFGKDGVNGKDGKDGNNGVPGKDGKYTISNFAKNTSLTVPPTTGWTALPPALAVSEYLWQRQGEVTPPATQPTTWQTAFRISGPAGSNGSDGKNGTNGINGKDGRYTLLQYAKNTSTTVAPTTGFTEAPPVLATNEFLWMRKGDVIPPSTTPASWTAPTRISGLHGQDGQKGDQGIQGVQGPVGEPLGDGVMLFTDPDFSQGNNNVYLYNNASNGVTTVERITRPSDSPSKSTHIIRVTNKGAASPGLGGYYQPTTARANAVFIHKIIAKIPIGYKIHHFNNPIGNGGSFTWLTSQEGTGRYETYIYKIICGTSGTFSSFGYVALLGTVGTTASPIIWDVCYSTIFDMSIPDRRLDFLTTTMVGNSIATGTLLVGQNGNATAGITGFRASGETSNVAFWAGLSYDNRTTAPFRVYTDGRLFATQANISGTINAIAGTFNNVTANNLTVNSGKFTGTVNANAGTFNNVTANNLTVNSGTFKGRIEAESGYFGGFLVNNQGMINDITKNDHKLEFGYQVAWTGIKSALGMNYKFMYSEGAVSNIHNCNSQIVNTASTGTEHNIALLLNAARSNGGRNHALMIEKGDIAGFSLYHKLYTGVYNVTVQKESVTIIAYPHKDRWVEFWLPTGENRWDGRVVKLRTIGKGNLNLYPDDAYFYNHDEQYIGPGGVVKWPYWKICGEFIYSAVNNTWYVLQLTIG